jgi:hypothetical protein
VGTYTHTHFHTHIHRVTEDTYVILAERPFAQGGMRFCTKLIEIDTKGENKSLVAKVFVSRKDNPIDDSAYFHEAMTQTVASSFAKQFNKQCDMLGIGVWCRSVLNVCACAYVCLQSSLKSSATCLKLVFGAGQFIYVCACVYVCLQSSLKSSAACLKLVFGAGQFIYVCACVYVCLPSCMT